MSLTVKQLIARLRKHDPEALVVWQAHDQGPDECDGWVRSVADAEDCLLKSEGVEKLVVLMP